MKMDWLSDLSPLHKAQQSWFDGSYQNDVEQHLLVPNDLPFAISCGNELLADHIRRFRFSPAVIQRLGQVADQRGRSMFQESYLNHLQRLKLRVNVFAAPEGTLLLPGEPLLIVQGALLQVQLLESAFNWLIWQSTLWATEAARSSGPEALPFDSDDPARRAMYIGGKMVKNQTPAPWPGMTQVINTAGESLLQIRRLFNGDVPLGDVWMTARQDKQASASDNHIRFKPRGRQAPLDLVMTRFQHLYHPVLLKGHPVLYENGTEYLRQRCLRQMEIFQKISLDQYPAGWYEESGSAQGQ